MQSWSNPGQNDGNGQDAWQTDFTYTDQAAAFDPNQPWAQHVAGQPSAFSHIHPDPSSFFDSTTSSANAFMPPESLHGNSTNSSTFQPQHYAQHDHDTVDTTFHNLHPNLYAHGAKVTAASNANQLDQAQAFAQHNFALQQGNPNAFRQQPQQFPQVHAQQPQSARQHGQQYVGFPQNPSATVQTQHVVPPQGGAFHQSAAATQPTNNQAANFQAEHHLSYAAPGHQYHLQNEQHLGQNYQDANAAFQGHAAANEHGEMQQGLNFLYPDNGASPAAKKRKRSIKSAEPPSDLTPLDPAPETSAKKPEDMDAYPAPVPTAAEQDQLNKFSKRSKSAQAKYPSIAGLPHLVFDGSMKMPAPKSFDKLAPLVTLPPRSGKAMVPELGYSLPCEIQGKFTGQYRPAPDRAGLNERRVEAKDLLDQFETSMKGIGKRRPKYTEYPHAFKEQMKSDEAVKNKAEKKAKKELEGDRNKPIRSAVRPGDPVEAASWDIVGIVHIDQSVARTSALIAQRVQQAGDFFIKLRGEMNKAKQELDQMTKDKKPTAQLDTIKADYDRKKEAFYRALDSTVEHADDAVLDNLGGHQKLILSLINALISCIKASDFSGKLPKIVLELISNFRMTRKIADATNFETVRKRFGDRGDSEVKELVQDINNSIKKLAKASEPETATGYTGTSAASRLKTSGKPSADSNSKRGRDDDSDNRIAKKVVVEQAGSSSLFKKLAQPKVLPQAVSKPVTASAKNPISAILPGKIRPTTKPAPKPEPPVSAGSPAAPSEEKSKAPARKVNDNKTEQAKTSVSKPTSSASSSALSGIASLLDSINAPKTEAATAAAAAATTTNENEALDDSENAEQKSKRLRKMARRKLRVTWKPEHELVQIKMFQKEDDEDEGRASNMIRDAADDKSEGMMLKQRVGMDDDDDDDDVPYQPWIEPVETDFSNLTADTRSKNFITRGGTVAFTTEEQKRIAEREQRELMAIYTDPTDIPPTPKSPPQESSISSNVAKVGQLPSEDGRFAEIQRRWADEQQMGVDQALMAAVQRLDAKQNPANKLNSILGRLQNHNDKSAVAEPAPVAAVQPVSIVASNVPLIAGRNAEEGILTWLRSDKIAGWRDPNPVQGDLSRPHRYSDASTQTAGDIIEAVAKYLQNKPYPAIAPPDWMLQYEDRVREWWFGYNKEAPARQRREDERRARAMVEAGPMAGVQSSPDLSYYAQQQEYAPYMAILQQMNGGVQAAVAPPVQQQQQSQMNDNQLQSILSAINQGYQQPTQAGGSDAAYQLMMQMTQGQGSQPLTSGGDREWERGQERDRERIWERDKGPDEPLQRKKKATLPPHKPANKALIGTKACTFWQQGKCARGDMCTFRHD